VPEIYKVTKKKLSALSLFTLTHYEVKAKCRGDNWHVDW